MKKLILLFVIILSPISSRSEEDKDVYKYLNLFGETFEKLKITMLKMLPLKI